MTTGFDARAVRAVVFDLDGTLIDSYAAITLSLNHARTSLGRPELPKDEVRRAVGRGLPELIADLVGAEHVDDGIRLFRQRYAEVYSEHTSALPGARRTLERLHGRGLALAVASNKPARFSEPILGQLGMLRYVGRVEGPDSCGAHKPDPTMIQTCLDHLRVAAGDALYVGDMVLDAESGARAGVPAVLVAGGSSDAVALRATGRPVLACIAELPELLSG